MEYYNSGILAVEYYNSGILAAHFNESPATTINIYYAPAEGTTETINNYEHLIDIIRTVPKHDVLLVIGDYNAYLGLHDALYAFHDRTNNNGKLLLNYSPEANLINANTRFQRKGGKLFTFMSEMNNCKSQIDYGENGETALNILKHT